PDRYVSLCSARVRGSSGGPTTATSTGPSSAARATASPHPANQACFPASTDTVPSAACAASRWRADPVSAAYDSSAPAAAYWPEDVALSVGSCGRWNSRSASSAVSKKPHEPSPNRSSTVSSSVSASRNQRASPITPCSAISPSATLA